MKQLKRYTMFCVFSGTAGIALTGGYHVISLFVILLSCFLGFYKDGRFLPPLVRKNLFVNTVILLYVFVFIIDTVIIRNPVSSLTRLLTFLLILKILNIKERRDCLLIILLAFVQLTVAASLTTDLTFIIPLLCFLFFSISALIALSHRDTPGMFKLSIRYFFSASLLGFLFFFIIPHYGTGYFGARTRSAERETGFSERVDLGNIGKAKRNSRIVMRVDLPFTYLPGESLRYRGMVFDQYDGFSWMKDKHELRKLRRKGDEMLLRSDAVPPGQRLRQVISLEPIDTITIFYAGEPLSLSTSDFRTVFVDSYGDLSFSFKRRMRVRYEVISMLPSYGREKLMQADWSNFPEEIADVYLQLPEMDKEIEHVTQAFTATAENQYELCKKIESYVTRSCHYSLDTSGIDPSNPLKSFLIDKKVGNCEFFATSMAVMLRMLGIPSRVVGGYLGGEYSFFSGRYIIRQSDAHLWVEVYFNDIGWVTFDPTPPEYAVVTTDSILSYLASLRDFLELSWDTYIISLDLLDQTNFFGRMVEYSYLSYAKGKSMGRHAIAAMQKMFGERVLPSLRELGLLVFLVLLIVSCVLVSLLLIKKVRIGKRSKDLCPIGFYRIFLLLMKKKGLKKKPWQTPREFQKELSEKLQKSSSAIKDLFVDDVAAVTDIYYRIRFGRKSLQEPEKKELIRRLRGLKRLGGFRFD